MMAFTVQQAVNHVCGKGFSHRTATKIVAALGPKKVFEGGDEALSSTGEASAHVQSFGYSPDAADKIVRHVEPHIVLAHKALDNDSSETHSFWDADLEGDEAAPESKTIFKK